MTLAASTIHRVLLRRGISRLRDLDVIGDNMRRPTHRYEYPAAGGMAHIDVNKIGRIPTAVAGRTAKAPTSTTRPSGVLTALQVEDDRAIVS